MKMSRFIFNLFLIYKDFSEFFDALIKLYVRYQMHIKKENNFLIALLLEEQSISKCFPHAFGSMSIIYFRGQAF